MTCRTIKLLTLTTLILITASAFGAENSGFELSVLVDEVERPEYTARGTVYVEALRGKSYALRLTNHLPHRVAVALSVDGLNSIDAKHTSPAKASKWVIDPYDSIVISGWQVNQWAARQFFFTGERHSYGAALGKTDNLGVIEAVFFREKIPVHTYHHTPSFEGERPDGESRDQERSRSEAGAGRAPAGAAVMPPPAESDKNLSDEYAATGMGSRRHHEVERIELDLEKTPSAVVKIRYEFRPQLAQLGVLPRTRSPIDRREQARGFDAYCPELN